MLFSRMKTVACRYWGVSPWELNRRIDEGGVSFQEVQDLIHLLSHDPLVAPWLFSYLTPVTVNKIKTVKKQEKQLAQFGQLLQFMKPKNDQEKEFLESLKKEVHGGS